ncbi:small VCP/p97-interacting protein [Leclercia adecarboxylata]|uniref:small VCP/p97-interacting protein n=1 Tax=Leclercia adecarboxylata TaxID=83655 RepID=UPI00399AFC06
MTINKQALRIPERKKHNWGQAVMRDCDFCNQWALTAKHDDGGCICASCCDSEYTSDLKVTLATALEQLEAAEKRIAELEAREVKLPQRHSMLHRDNFDEPYHTEMVYKQHQVLEALHDAGIITKVGE